MKTEKAQTVAVIRCEGTANTTDFYQSSEYYIIHIEEDEISLITPDAAQSLYEQLGRFLKKKGGAV
jgi:hypothetical protein